MSKNAVYGIICAMDSELNLLKQDLENARTELAGGLLFHIGDFGGHRTILVKSGIGKVAAARCTQLLIDRFNPDYIINSGIAGGVGEGLQIGDVVIGRELVQYDFDVTVFGHVRGYLCTGEDDSVPTIFYSDPELIDAVIRVLDERGDIRYRTGRIATGDVFLSDTAIEHKYLREMHADAAEMESAAIAQVAAGNGTKFLIIRTMSDLGNGNSAVDYDTFEQKTADQSAQITEALIRDFI
ncbi:MAG: 5'-methylthioadenosine/adenosylhomocysteine nucleosidase [Clostridia bacterium]|nr:5'-methylthioadenosine/adenosylhomocysteine nucleosidase [Clostridia bacterium]